MNYQILRLPEAIKIVGLSRSTIYNQTNDGTFPKLIKLSVRTIGWTDESIQDWIAEQIRK